MTVHIVETTTARAAPEFRELRERNVDLMLGRLSGPLTAEDLEVEPIFDELIVVAASAHSAWARRERIDLAGLANEIPATYYLDQRESEVRIYRYAAHVTN